MDTKLTELEIMKIMNRLNKISDQLDHIYNTMLELDGHLDEDGQLIDDE